MSDISAAAVASLRARTGVSILECKKALEEAKGDEEAAIEVLRKSGAASAAKKADREQSEGLVFTAEGDGKAAILFLKCETDFVARDENFAKGGQELADTLLKDGEDGLNKAAESVLPDLVQKLGENITLGENQIVEAATIGAYTHSNSKIAVVVGLEGGTTELAKDAAMHAAAMNPSYITPEEVSSEEVEQEKKIWQEQLAAEGKPAEIMDKIIEGKEKKFREENALTTQEFVKDPSKTVGAHLGDAKVTAYVRMAV